MAESNGACGGWIDEQETAVFAWRRTLRSRPAGMRVNGAGGNRTPVPRRSACRVSVCSCYLLSPCRTVSNDLPAGHDRQMSHFAEACQPIEASPMLRSVSYRTSVTERRGQAASAYWVLPVKSVAPLVTRLDAPRHATTYVPRPVDASRPRWVARSYSLETTPQSCSEWFR